MTDINGAGAIADQVMNRYQEHLNLMVKQHEDMLRDSRAGLEQLISESNSQMDALVAKVNQVDQPPAKPLPEVAWVGSTADGKKDHLVLNPQAIELIDKLFTAINDVLPELAKLVKKR